MFLSIATLTFAARATRKVWEINWKPTPFLNGAPSSIAATIIQAGAEESVTLMTSVYVKDIKIRLMPAGRM